MSEMSRSTAGHGSDGLGLLKSTINNAKGGSRGGGMLAAITGAQQAQVAERMQGAQHQHETGMQIRQHGHEQNLAMIGGAVDIEKTKIGARAQVHVARAQGASQVDIARVQADSQAKEQAATQRHEIRIGQQQHTQHLEKTAQEHHLATGLVGSLMRHAAPGTDLNFGTAGGTKASFTTKPEAPKEPTPAPAAAPEEPVKNTKAPAIRDPKTGKAMRNPDYVSTKKAPSVKEVTGKKAAPKTKK